jgi:hypothetical protein
MYVKPANGLKIRDPFKKDHLPPQGREVSETDLYWHRHLLAGDIVVVPLEEPTAAPGAAAPDGGALEAAPAPEPSVGATRKPHRNNQSIDRSTEQ